MNTVEVKSPGCFSATVAADNRRYEFDLKNGAVLTQKIPVETIFIGDSITHFWELDAYFKASDGLLLNRGISGDSTQYLKLRFEADVLQLKPRNVIIFAGINDFWALEAFPWNYDRTPVDLEKAVENCVANLKDVMSRAIAEGIQVAICSVMPVDLPWSTYQDQRCDVILEVNRRLRQEAESCGAAFVDYHSFFVDEDGKTLRKGYSVDGVHPLAVGYKEMSRILRSTLEQKGIQLLAR